VEWAVLAEIQEVEVVALTGAVSAAVAASMAVVPAEAGN
jgi:hypothetical protein